MENKCPECQHPSLIINLWGFPDEHEVIKLESDGHIVNLQGCVPPEKDEEAFDLRLQEILAKHSTKHAEGGRVGLAKGPKDPD